MLKPFPFFQARIFNLDSLVLRPAPSAHPQIELSITYRNSAREHEAAHLAFHFETALGRKPPCAAIGRTDDLDDAQTRLSAVVPWPRNKIQVLS